MTFTAKYRYNKREYNKISKLAVCQNRQKFDVREQIPIRYLAHYYLFRDGCTRLESIKSLILCMDTGHDNYRYLPEKDKELVKKLLDNEEVVDIVLASVFQWFGTSCGLSDIRGLVKEIDTSLERRNKIRYGKAKAKWERGHGKGDREKLVEMKAELDKQRQRDELLASLSTRGRILAMRSEKDKGIRVEDKALFS